MLIRVGREPRARGHLPVLHGSPRPRRGASAGRLRDRPHFPEARAAANPYLALLEAVVTRQALLIATWMGVGFVQGVMNTDNMSIAGETIDYGPCAFMEAYHPETVFSSIDQFGRYAFAISRAIAQWNLARLAETLLPLIDENADVAVEKATSSVIAFSTRFDHAWLATLRRKLGLAGESHDDGALMQKLFDLMQASAADFTLTFRRLGDFAGSDGRGRCLRNMFAAMRADSRSGSPHGTRASRRASRSDGPRARRWRASTRCNIPRNHRVEEALRAAARENDFAPSKR